ncbi:MAG: methyltransferase domain-containing protein [Spongiibacteraceae bacterium]|nr:methyltransferase domain-containing protein [Spongiibacteraceae bacterium]
MSGYTALTNLLTDYNNPKSLGYIFRRRRAQKLIEILEIIHRREGCINIIDIGGRENYWDIIPDTLFSSLNIKVTLVNNDDELKAGKSMRVSNSVISQLKGDGRDLAHLKDNSFDLVHSNSVIEHVGEWDSMKAMAKEINRLALNHFVQTPNFWFPFEPHFLTPMFHWLPEPIRISLLMRMRLGHIQKRSTLDAATKAVQSIHLLDKKMMSALFPESSISEEKFFLLSKSILAIRI